MDQILEEYLDSHICDINVIKYIKKQIKKNYGFKYENVLKILSMAIGAYNLENILDKININLFQTLLDQYSEKRNNAAHTHIVGTTTTYDTPSVILNDFKSIKPIIFTIEQEIQSLP